MSKKNSRKNTARKPQAPRNIDSDEVGNLFIMAGWFSTLNLDTIGAQVCKRCQRWNRTKANQQVRPRCLHLRLYPRYLVFIP